MAKKITHWLLSGLILALGFGQFLRFDYQGTTSIYLHDILVLAIIIVNFRRLFTLTLPRGIKIFLIAVGLSWLNAALNYQASSLLIPFLYTVRLLAYLTLYCLLKAQKNLGIKKYFRMSAMVMATIGLTQYFLLPDMRWAQYLGWDDHLSRLTLPHYDPTFTGVMLTLAFLTVLPKLAKVNLNNLILTTFYSLPILLTYARSVYLSLVITLLLVIKQKKILLISLAIFVIGVLALPERFGEGTNLLRTYSITSRLESDLGYVAKYNWQLVIGRGLNTLPLDIPATRYPNHATGPNNSYLYLLATTGLLGLIGWGIWLKNIYQSSSYKPMLIFFFVASLFNNVMFYPFALLWVLLTDSSDIIS